MEGMSTPETIFESKEPIRPLKRVEYEHLASLGYFEHEKVELLLGVVVAMTPIDPAHSHAGTVLHELLARQLGERALVRSQNPFAASDISEPEPDVLVVPRTAYWKAHPTHAFLVVEVSRTSLSRDQGPKCLIYGTSEVDEYWIVNQVDDVVEVYRDRRDGNWLTCTVHRRGDTLSMAMFPDVRIAESDILPPP